MTAHELLDALLDLRVLHDLSRLQIVIRLTDSDGDTHMGGVACVSIESGCTEIPALVLDCDQDPSHCPLPDDDNNDDADADSGGE